MTKAKFLADECTFVQTVFLMRNPGFDVQRIMELKSDYQAKIQNIAKMLPPEKLGEVLDFMEFLYRKEKGFNYTTVENSAEYVRRLRDEESFTPQGNQNVDPAVFRCFAP